MIDLDHVLYELAMLGLAFVLASAVGIERSRKQKSAGLRTHVLVGVGSAMFTLISAYGFGNEFGSVTTDPSRIAAQVVSGIGFLGAGVIFVRKNVVSGLTSAATIWVVAAIGMACGAGMPLLAVGGTALHLVTVGPLSHLGDRLRPEPERVRLEIVYVSERGVLRAAMEAARAAGLAVSLLSVVPEEGGRGSVAVLEISGPALGRSRTEVVENLSNLPDVKSVLVLSGLDEE